MKRVNKKKIIVLIIIVILIIFGIMVIKGSKASSVVEISLEAIDSSSLLASERCKIDAINDGDSGYYLILPQSINGKVVTKYTIERQNTSAIAQLEKDNTVLEKYDETLVNKVEEVEENLEETISNTVNETNVQINTEESTQNDTENSTQANTTVLNTVVEENNTVSNTMVQTEPVSNSIIQEENTISENVLLNEVDTFKEVEDNETTKLPNAKVYITKKEFEEKLIKVSVEYDTKTVNDSLLYNKILEEIVETNENNMKNVVFNISGYMPADAVAKITKQNSKNVEESITTYMRKDSSLAIAYDIKLVIGDTEYEPRDFDENVKISIKGLNKINYAEQQYKVLHVTDTTIEEISQINMKDSEIIFHADSFSTYAILLEDVQPLMSPRSMNAFASNENIWDGNVATSIRFGTGTSADPYLITSGNELAYIAARVNNGSNEFENTYFELISDIDLNQNNWEPIGTNDYSFKGIFDGGGYTIGNGIMTVATSALTTKEPCGFFGSIGDGNSYAIVKNIEFDNMTIDIAAAGNGSSNNSGIYVGIVAGKLYNHARIENVIAKNSNINSTATIQIRSNAFQVFIGGIAGCALNSSTNENNPGNDAWYAIENCFSDVDFNLNITLRWESFNYRAQYAVGGVIGAVRSQPVWPENCLYTGNINAEYAFIGPIIAYLRSNTSYTSTNNYQTLWYCNDAGALTMSSYYSEYTANSTTFTSTVTSGNTSNSTAYRISTRTSNFGNTQGVNKGRYITDISTMLDRFTSYINGNTTAYTNWIYYDGTYSLIPRMTVSVDGSQAPIYSINALSNYIQNPTYTYNWYVNGVLDTSLTGNSINRELSWDNEYDIEVIITDGTYMSLKQFIIPSLRIDIAFSTNPTNKTIVATLTGTGLPYVQLSDYTYQWYSEDVAGLETTEIEGATSTTLSNAEPGILYTLIATNNAVPARSVQGTVMIGERIAIFVDYNYGNNYNDGLTPSTAVETLEEAYSKLDNEAYGVSNNVIVIIGNYTSGNYYTSQTATTYAKKATLTGIYGGIDYEGGLYLEGADNYKHLTADTCFQYLTLMGSTSSYGGGSLYFYAQGNNLTMGEGLVMERYARSNTNQGLIEGNAPAFHVFAGWLRYNYSELPNNNTVITIKSGTYGRIILGGSSGTNSTSNMQQTTSRNFIGKANEMYNVTVNIDIENSTTPSTYAYDINLLVGGSAWGNEYSNVVENIYAGRIGRLLGASIGDSSARPYNWNYPLNTFIGSTVVNVIGGSITELYGGCLGRNMSALSGNSNEICDSYYYGTIDINIIGGEVLGNIYGAGAGGVTGHSDSSSDVYKSYGEGYDTFVNISVTGGRVGGNIYGGGYGYTEYLTQNSTAVDAGALYGGSKILIGGNAIIAGEIYGAGRGYNLSNKPNIAQMFGNTEIITIGTPDIQKEIYGAGAGLQGYENMAKLNGDSVIRIDSYLSNDVYGGGNIAQVNGATYIYIGDGRHVNEIYGGGNVGNVNGTSYIYVSDGGESSFVYGGGKSSDITTTNVFLQGGDVDVIYGGSKTLGDVITSNVTTTSGNVGTVFGGNNEGGNTFTSNVNTRWCYC